MVMRMNCKDCIFNEICERREDLVQLDDFTWDEYGESNEVEKYCSIFRNKADFVEVVRCPDCKHCIKDTEYSKKINMGYCEYDNTVHRKTHFCGYGERRKDDE